MEVLIQTLPSSSSKFVDNQASDEDLDHDQEDDLIPVQNAFVREPKPVSQDNYLHGKIEVHPDVDRIFHIEKYNSIPEIHLHFTKSKEVSMRTDLLIGLNLMLETNVKFGNKLKVFDETVSYDYDEGKKLQRYVYKNKGYLVEESNYYYFTKHKLSKDTEACSFINGRVILFWRGTILDEITVKRILAVGLVLLIGKATLAQTYVKIGDLVPNNQDLEVSIDAEQNKYVLIGVEKRLFNI
jgi:hypothetical protein